MLQDDNTVHSKIWVTKPHTSEIQMQFLFDFYFVKDAVYNNALA